MIEITEITEITETLTVERLDELEAELARSEDTDGKHSANEKMPIHWRALVGLIALAREGLAGRAEIERLKAKANRDPLFLGPCPICGGIEGCDDTVSERRAAYADAAVRARKAEAELAAALDCIKFLEEAHAADVMLVAVLVATEKTEKARADAAEARVRSLETDVVLYKRAADDDKGPLLGALEFYADPETWFAVALFPDHPCGEIVDDFSDTEALGEKPGKRAREALEAFRTRIVTRLTELAPVSKDSLRTAEPGEGDHHGN